MITFDEAKTVFNSNTKCIREWLKGTRPKKEKEKKGRSRKKTRNDSNSNSEKINPNAQKKNLKEEAKQGKWKQEKQHPQITCDKSIFGGVRKKNDVTFYSLFYNKRSKLCFVIDRLNEKCIYILLSFAEYPLIFASSVYSLVGLASGLMFHAISRDNC